MKSTMMKPLYPVQYNLRLSDQMFAALLKESTRTGASIAEIIRRAIVDAKIR